MHGTLEKGGTVLDRQLIILALGILLGMLFYRRTGFSPGGILSPGLAALYFSDISFIGFNLGVALLLALVLEVLVRRTGLFGRQRIATALCLALFLRMGLAGFMEPSSGLTWLGWVVPGLVGADMQRQGLVPTVGGFLGVSAVTFLLGGMIP